MRQSKVERTVVRQGLNQCGQPPLLSFLGDLRDGDAATQDFGAHGVDQRHHAITGQAGASHDHHAVGLQAPRGGQHPRQRSAEVVR